MRARPGPPASETKCAHQRVGLVPAADDEEVPLRLRGGGRGRQGEQDGARRKWRVMAGARTEGGGRGGKRGVRGAKAVARPRTPHPHHPSTYAKTSGATMVASDSMMNFGVSTPSLPQVIFSLGTAPE